jgi:hypothetical protein
MADEQIGRPSWFFLGYNLFGLFMSGLLLDCGEISHPLGVGFGVMAVCSHVCGRRDFFPKRFAAKHRITNNVMSALFWALAPFVIACIAFQCRAIKANW